MKPIARAAAATVATAFLVLTATAAALAQALPSDADTPTDSPSAWNRVWPWLLLGAGLFVLLLLGAVGFSWQRRRATQAAAPPAQPPPPVAERKPAGPRDIAVLTFAAINGAEQAFAAVRDHAAGEPWVREVAFAEHHRHGRLVVRGTFAGRYLDLDEHLDAIDPAKPAGALLEELRADVPEGSSALVVFAAAGEVDEMIAALHGAGGEVTRHHVTGEGAAALEASVAQAPPAAPPPAAV
jgi:hypothetical protein